MSIQRIGSKESNIAHIQWARVAETTGTLSHNPGTYTVNGVSWSYYRWTSGTGSILLSAPGVLRILVVGGGGGGGGNNAAYGGAAGSGGVREAWLYLPAARYTVVVGAAGNGSTGTGGTGGASSFHGNVLFSAGGKGSAGNTTPNPGNGVTWSAGGTNDAWTSDITGSNVTYGNPGAGAQSSPAARSANTGDGGYGALTSGGGAAGGSGVVIVALPTPIY